MGFLGVGGRSLRKELGVKGEGEGCWTEEGRGKGGLQELREEEVPINSYQFLLAVSC